MILKLYNKKLTDVSGIEVGKTYYKDMFIGFIPALFLPITILSHSGGIVTATIGDDKLVQTLTENEAYNYINTQGGYDDTV